jgi:hypothetical protein
MTLADFPILNKIKNMILNHLIKAKYLGEDKCFSYKHRRQYYLLVTRHNWLFGLIFGYRIEVKRLNGEGWEGYKGIKEFAKDWKITIPVVTKLTIRTYGGGGGGGKGGEQ